MFKAVFAKSLLAVALSASLLPVAASAGEVQNRINRQNARLNQGVASGQLTRGEYDRTEYRDQRIEQQRDRDLRNDGGHLTSTQYHELNRELNRNSSNIYYDKHNRSHQPGAPTI